MNEIKKNLVFSGGGKKVKNDADTLRSDDTAELLLGLCEGPIEGLENGKHSFFIDDTPLLTVEGDNNFEECTLDVKLGDATQDESIKYELGGAARSKSPSNGNLPEEGSVKTIETDGSNFDYIDVRMNISQLYNSGSSGVKKATANFRIEYMLNTEGVWRKVTGKDISIYGKTTAGYTRDYRIKIQRNEDPTVFYTIRVTRLTKASSTTGNGLTCEMALASIEMVDSKSCRFPGTAIAHLTLKTSDQISGLPELYGIYKLLKIKVPSNYDPISRTYTGFWDGTFKLAWTDNPAWCLYDLITNTTYGVNSYYPVIPDKWDFYEASQYCDELVGSGSYDEYGNEILEPRYTFNYIITDSQSGPSMLNYIAGTFNATIYEDSSGTVRLAYENNDKQASHIFNPSNITEAGFSYSFTDPSVRYNDYTVTFINPDIDWEQDRRRVTTPYGTDNIEEWGRIPFDYDAIGCIKESEAIRKTRFKLISSLKEVMSVQFTTTRTMIGVNLFDTILVCDPDMNWSQSGRIKSINESRSSVELRDSVFLEAGIPYTFNVQTATGLFSANLVINEYGRVYTLELDNILPNDIDDKAVFYITGTGDGTYGDAKPFRVVSIAEGGSEQDTITVTAIEVYRNKQFEADTGIILENSDASTRPNYGNIPQVLDCSFTEYYNSVRKENALVIAPTLDTDHYPYYSGNFKVYSRLYGTEDDFEERQIEEGDTIYSHPAGEYEFKILPESTLGLYPSLEKAPIFEFEVSERGVNEADRVYNFKAEGNVENIVLTWDKSENDAYYQIRIGESWEKTTEADIIANGLKDNIYYYTGVEDGNVYKFLIKSFNEADNECKYASVAYGSLSAPKDVEKFYVTPNLDSLRFDWEAPGENYVEYEVRVGQAWGSAYTLFTASGNNQTVLNPGQDDNQIYFIKAKSRKGIYSEGTMKAYVRQTLKQNRNVILEKSAVRVPVYGIGEESGSIIGYEYDGTRNVYKVGADDSRPTENDLIGYIINDGTYNVYDKNDSSKIIGTMSNVWRGVCHGMNIVSPITPNIMAMDSSFYNGELFFPVHLNEKTVARNWYSSEYFKFGERLTFDDLDYPWDSEEARVTSWLNEQGNLNYGGTLKTMITWKKDEEYLPHLGLRFNGTTESLQGETPIVEDKIKYLPAKVDNGFLINKISKLAYNIPSENFGETFSARFRLYLNAASKSYSRLLTLEDDEGRYLTIYLDDYKVFVERSDDILAYGDYEYSTYMDFMSLQISQSEDKLTLDYSLEYVNMKNKIEVPCEPLTTFTKIYFGEKHD